MGQSLKGLCSPQEFILSHVNAEHYTRKIGERFNGAQENLAHNDNDRQVKAAETLCPVFAIDHRASQARHQTY